MSVNAEHNPSHRILVAEGRFCGDFGGLRPGKVYCLLGQWWTQNGGPMERVCRETPSWRLYRDGGMRYWLDIDGTAGLVQVVRRE